MKIQRTKNAARNILFDGMLQAMRMVVPFIMRTIVLHYLGIEFLGLGGLFRSILSFLNLAELGVANAMVFSMYKPIAEDDRDTICALMKLYRTLYRIIGLFILAVGLFLTPFLKNLIKGTTPDGVNLYVLYFMNLGITVISYWLFAYKTSLLYAHQRRDISSKVSLLVLPVQYGLQILVLVVFRSYYLYLAVQMCSQVATNVLTAWQVTRLYPGYSPRGDLPKERKLDIAKRVRDLFTSKFSYIISTSSDTLVISSFLGLSALALFQNYFYIITSLRTMLDVIIGACIAGVGNSLITETREKNFKDLQKLTVLYGWLMGVSSAMLLCMVQPFMTIWMGEENLLALGMVVCFAVYFYLQGMNKLLNMFKDAAGIWRRDRMRPLTGALVNLSLNLLTVRWLGLYGVILSTVFSIVVVEIPWLLHNLFAEVFPHDYLALYLRSFFGFVGTALLGCAISWFLCGRLTLAPWPAFFVNAVISFIVPNLVFFAIYGRSRLFLDCVKQIKRVIIRKKA